MPGYRTVSGKKLTVVTGKNGKTASFNSQLSKGTNKLPPLDFSARKCPGSRNLLIHS